MTEEIIAQVEEIVSPVYLVGGSVRDVILGRPPKDYDFTTPLEPDEVEAKVKAAGRHAYAIGKKFGTIGFKVADKSGAYHYVEVTTFRREKYEAGSRKPQVEFVSELKDDLGRRDFTINAIALKDGHYYDPFGGRIDIMAKKIKAVGDAKSRLKEDPLRMLRAARLSSQLNFDVDPNLIGTMRKMSSHIIDVSRERWVQEIDKILISQDPQVGIAIMQGTKLMKYMLPEISILKSDQFHDMLMAVLNEDNDPDLRWGGLLSQIGKPAATLVISDDSKQTYKDHGLVAREMAVGICARLRFSNERTKIIAQYKIKA